MKFIKFYLVFSILSLPVLAQEDFEELPAPETNQKLPEAPVEEPSLVPPDPFANEAPINETAPVESAPAPATPPQNLESAPTRPQFQDPFTQNPGGAPMEVPPVVAPAAPAPSVEPSFEPPRAKPFEFPDPSKAKGQGPITQDIVRGEQVRQVTTEGTWSLGFSGGGAFNVNRRLNQSAFEAYADYRISPSLEIGGLTYFRSGGDNLLGLLMTMKYFFRVTDPDSFRLEVAPVFGMGWTFRGEDKSFNESRFPVRYGFDTLFYAYPNFAIVVHSHMESFLFGKNEQKKWVSYFKGGGPLTQIIVNLGVRFQF